MKRYLTARIVSRLILVLMGIFFLAPLFWMVSTSLKSDTELLLYPPPLVPAHPQWSNYPKAVNFIPFGRYFLNSAIITALATAGAVLVNPLIAYGLSKVRWPGREIVFVIILATIFVPFPVTMVPLFLIFAKLGWINTFLPLTVPTFFGQPFYIFLLRQFFMTIPAELSDASRIDGASEWQIFARVIYPLARPAVTVVGIFALLAAWNDFLGPLIYLQDMTRYTLAIGLQMYQAQNYVEWHLMMAASTLVALPVIAVFILAQRFFVEGMTMGAMKG